MSESPFDQIQQHPDTSPETIGLQYTPKKLAQYLIDSPPLIDGIKPKFYQTLPLPHELQAAEHLITLQADNPDLQPVLEAIIRYLQAPTRTDTFNNHDQRRQWRQGVFSLLKTIDHNLSNNRKQEIASLQEYSFDPHIENHESPFTDGFNKHFKNNRHSRRNLQGNLQTAFSLIPIIAKNVPQNSFDKLLETTKAKNEEYGGIEGESDEQLTKFMTDAALAAAQLLGWEPRGNWSPPDEFQPIIDQDPS